MKKYFLPLLGIILTGFSLHHLAKIWFGQWGFLWLSLWRCIGYFMIGVSLRFLRKRRKENYWKKLAISVTMIFLLMLEWGYLPTSIIKNTFSFLGLEGNMLHLLYLYCGWLFFD